MTRFEKRSPTTSAEATTSSATTCASPAEATAAAEATTTAAAATATETAATTASASRETAAATAATESATTATASGETTGTTAAAASTSTTAPGLLDLGSSRRGLGLGQELLEGEELLAADEELVAGLEAGGLDAVAGLDGKVYLVDGTEDLVHLADGRLVLEEDLGVEVRDLWVGGLADHLTLAGVHEGAELEDLGRGAKVALSETAAACFCDDCKSQRNCLRCLHMDLLRLVVHNSDRIVGTRKSPKDKVQQLLTTASAASTETAPSSGRTSERHFFELRVFDDWKLGGRRICVWAVGVAEMRPTRNSCSPIEA